MNQIEINTLKRIELDIMKDIDAFRRQVSSVAFTRSAKGRNP